MKGYSLSRLDRTGPDPVDSVRQLYERVWDEADYVVPPAENGAFFVTTNVVITPNQVKIRLFRRKQPLYYCLQTLGTCAEDPAEVPHAVCRPAPRPAHSPDCTRDKHLTKSEYLTTFRSVFLSSE